jgi:two-component system sensor histidine kinase DesK
MSPLPMVHPDSPFGRYPTASYLRWQALVQLLVAAVLIQSPWAKDGFAWGWFLPTVLVLPVFVWLYVQAYVGSARSVPYCVAGIMLLGLALVPSNPSAVYLLLIACMLLGLLPSWRHGLYGVAAFVLLTALIDRFAHLPPRTAAGVAISGVFGWASCYLYLHNLRRDGELRLTQEQVRHLAMLAERERIGRDLHDLLGHTLSLVTLKSELARRLALTDPPRAQREMAEVERVARHALGEVRAADR